MGSGRAEKVVFAIVFLLLILRAGSSQTLIPMVPPGI
jgi:hypothetical protein